jgi:hypothetical protein
MMPSRQTTITRVRAPLVADEYGTEDAKRDWDDAEELDIPRCIMQPVAGTEIADGREAVSIRYRLFAPMPQALVATDRVEWDGLSYEVDGEPLSYPKHTEAMLKRVTG